MEKQLEFKPYGIDTPTHVLHVPSSLRLDVKHRIINLGNLHFTNPRTLHRDQCGYLPRFQGYIWPLLHGRRRNPEEEGSRHGETQCTSCQNIYFPALTVPSAQVCEHAPSVRAAQYKLCHTKDTHSHNLRLVKTLEFCVHSIAPRSTRVMTQISVENNSAADR